MKKIYSLLLFILCFVASTQLIAKYWIPYIYFDDVLFLIVTIISVLDLIISNKFSRTYSYLGVLFIIFILISFIFNFYSIGAFFAKSFFYGKPLLTFVFVSYLANKYMLLKYKKYLYNIFIFICLFSIFEFYLVQYIDWSYIHYFAYSTRFGLYRVSSVTWHPISLALLAFFSIIIGKEVFNDKRKWPYILFISSIMLSGTRFVILLMLIYYAYRFVISKKLLINRYKLPLKYFYLFFYPIIFLALFGLSTYINIKDYSTLRSITYRSGIELLNDPKTLILGTGIGSFGSAESVVYKSDVYDKINFPQHYKNILVSGNNSKSGTENFFFMVLVEFGVIGLFLYYAIILKTTNIKLTYFSTFYILIIVSITFVYPINALPFMYLVNIFFPFGKLKNK